MDTKQINDALDRIFTEENQRIVFWNDPEREFQNILPYLMLNNVNVIRLNEMGSLEVKIKVEREDPEGKYLCIPQPRSRITRTTGFSTCAFTAEVSVPTVRRSSLMILALPTNHSGTI